MRVALRHLALLLGSFAGVTVLATVAGAPNLGTAATFGVMAYVLVLVVVLTREGEAA